MYEGVVAAVEEEEKENGDIKRKSMMREETSLPSQTQPLWAEWAMCYEKMETQTDNSWFL